MRERPGQRLPQELAEANPLLAAPVAYLVLPAVSNPRRTLHAAAAVGPSLVAVCQMSVRSFCISSTVSCQAVLPFLRRRSSRNVQWKRSRRPLDILSHTGSLDHGSALAPKNHSC